MRKLRNFALLVILGATTLVACNKPSTTPTPTPASTNMSCLVNGTAWSANASAVIQFGVMNITGIQASDGQTVTITIGNTKAGTYDLSSGTSSSAGAYKPNSGNNTEGFRSGLSNTTGDQVVITAIDDKNKTISGTFSFTAQRGSDSSKRTITNGKFTNVPYTGSLPVTSSTLSASIDGVAWTTNSVFTTTAGGKFTISATKNDGSTIGFFLPDNVSTGTFTFTPFGTYVGQYNKNTSTYYQAQSGSITIATKTAAEMTGTFSFSAANAANSSDVVNVTNGTFDIKF